MELEEYVRYLTYMLEEFEDDACSTCPIPEPVFGELIELHEADECCKMCQQFVGLKYIEPKKDSSRGWGYYLGNGEYINRKCPCARPGKDGAIVRAWKYIEKYHEKKRRS